MTGGERLTVNTAAKIACSWSRVQFQLEQMAQGEGFGTVYPSRQMIHLFTDGALAANLRLVPRPSPHYAG